MLNDLQAPAGEETGGGASDAVRSWLQSKGKKGKLILPLARPREFLFLGGPTDQPVRRFKMANVDNPNVVQIFDTTLRDGEQSPGAT